KQIKRLQQAVSRKQQGGQHRKQAVVRRAKQPRRVANRRADTLHRLTSRLAQTTSVVVSADRKVSAMLKNQRLAPALAAGGCAQFRRHLEDKASWYGCRVIGADRWCASSKTCSGCGWGDH